MVLLFHPAETVIACLPLANGAPILRFAKKASLKLSRHIDVALGIMVREAPLSWYTPRMLAS